jgi:hypothetical protein
VCHRPVSDRCHGEGPRRRRLLLRLTSPRTRRVGGEAWPSGVIPAPPGRLAAACRQDPLPWQRHARTRVPQSQPPPLRSASSVARALQLSSRLNQSLQAAQAARLQPSVLAVPCAAVRRPAGCPPWAAQAASPGLRWSAARSLEPGVPAGTISHGRRPAACGLQSWSAAAAPAQQGVSLHLRRPEDAFPTVLWHKSV